MNTKNKNTKNKVKVSRTGERGRPAFVINIPRGAFTIKQLEKANPSVCTLTLRQNVSDFLSRNVLTRLESAQSGKRGKPLHRFIRSSVMAQLEAARATKLMKSEGSNTPTDSQPIKVAFSSESETPIPIEQSKESVATPAETVAGVTPSDSAK